MTRKAGAGQPAGIEVEVFVEAPRFIIFGDDEQSAHSAMSAACAGRRRHP